jgi:1-acyl-sn-glycerol-3-phosphate acyltransferase
MHRTHRPTRFLVAAEIFGRPVLGSILRRYDQIPIRRGERDGEALDDAIRSLREGALVAVAPEGRVNGEPDGGLQRVRSGTARVSLASGAALLPVGIWGTQSRWPREGPRYLARLRTPVGISIGPPILPVGDPDDPEVVAALSARIADGLSQEMGRARTLAEGGVPEEPGTVAPPKPSV